jgi:hypothetical protein
MEKQEYIGNTIYFKADKNMIYPFQFKNDLTSVSSGLVSIQPEESRV